MREEVLLTKSNLTLGIAILFKKVPTSHVITIIAPISQ